MFGVLAKVINGRCHGWALWIYQRPSIQCGSMRCLSGWGRLWLGTVVMGSGERQQRIRNLAVECLRNFGNWNCDRGLPSTEFRQDCSSIASISAFLIVTGIWSETAEVNSSVRAERTSGGSAPVSARVVIASSLLWMLPSETSFLKPLPPR